MKNLLKTVCIALPFLGINAFGQDLVKDSLKVQQIIEKTQKTKQNEVYVATITDAADVAFLSAYIDAKNKVAKQAADGYAAEYSFASAYKKGDKTVIPQIVKIINSKDPEAIEPLFNQLERDYDDKTPLVLDKPIKDAVFNLVTDEALEAEAVQFIGYNAIEGYLPLFESRYLSGKSTDEGRLFYWLAQSGNEKSLDRLLKDIAKTGKIASNWQATALDDYFKEDGPVTPAQKKLLDFAYAYLDKHPLTVADFENRSWSGYNEEDGDPKMTFFFLVADQGDKRSLPILKKAVPLAENVSEPDVYFNNNLKVKSLHFYSDAEKKQAVKQLLQDKPALIFDISQEIAQDKNLFNDAEINALQLMAFEKDYNAYYKSDFSGSAYNVFAFASLFSGKTPAEMQALADKHIASAQLRAELLKEYSIAKYSFDEVNQYLLANGFITALPTAEQLKGLADNERNETGYGAIFNALRINNIIVSFDAEADTVPLPYDELLEEFAKASKNTLSGVKSYVQYKITDDYENIYYHHIVCFKNKAYIMAPATDMGDWYDLATFDTLLDRLMAETGGNQTFHLLEADGQYITMIFGPEKNVEKLMADFNYNMKN